MYAYYYTCIARADVCYACMYASTIKLHANLAECTRLSDVCVCVCVCVSVYVNVHFFSLSLLLSLSLSLSLSLPACES